jgi:hypothetical protein
MRFGIGKIAVIVVAGGLALGLTGTGQAHAATTGTSNQSFGLGLIANQAKVSAPIVGTHAASVLPASVDLSQWAPPTGDQGQVGSCASWATDYTTLGWYQNRYGLTGFPLAPMYTYSQINGGYDGGSTLPDNGDIAVQQGVDTQADYTQGNYNWQDQPTAAEHANAANYKLVASHQDIFSTYPYGAGTAGQTAIETALAAGKPIVIGFSVYQNFENQMNQSSITLYAGPSGPFLGGHAVTALGYDATGLLIENQWGSSWGHKGFLRLSWTFVNNYVWEAMTFDQATPPTPPAPPIVKVSGTPWALSPMQDNTATPGYWVTTKTGQVASFGTARPLGDLSQIGLNAPIVGMATTPSNSGYWMLGGDGGIFTFGNSAFYGSTGALNLTQPVVGMAATPSGKGYWLVAADGGIFTFGDARFFGSTGAVHLNKQIVGMAATPTGQGYWLVASDGGIFAFGDAGFYGSTGNVTLAKPVVGMTGSVDGHGYRLVASDGGIFTFGDAAFYGSLGGHPQNAPVTTMASSVDGQGYYMIAADGAVYAFGDASYLGRVTN